MSRCTILAHVRRPDGTIVQSKLFKDLLHYARNRAEAKEHYAVATNKEFLEKVGDRAKFDENGEMTFDSYNEIIGVDENSRIVETLNKDIKAGVYDYGEAIGKLQDFNRNNPFRKSYMATVVPDNGKYRLFVVKRTPSNEARLEKAIHQQSVHDRILYYLNKAGVAVDFIKDGEKNGGRYSTVNAERTADGLYHLIKVAHGEHIEDDLAEECGHFVVGAMGDNPLVERLTALLDDDVQRRILGEKYDEKALGANSRREVAGVLVGQALQKELSNKTPWQKLANRIANLAKRIFYKLSGNEVRAAMMDANHIASKIAQGFASPNFNGNVETALKSQETLYSAKVSKNVSTYREIVQRLQLTSQQMSKIANDKFSDIMKALDATVEVGRSNAATGAFADAVALDGIAEALSQILDLCGPDKEIANLLDSIDFDNLDNFFDNIVDNGRKLRQVRVFLSNSIAVAKVIEGALAKEGETLQGPLDNIQLSSTGGLVSVNLTEALRQLQKINNDISQSLTTKEFHFFSRFLQEYYGEKYITHAARVLFKKQDGQLIFRPVAVKEKTVTVKDEIDDQLRNLESDISLFETYLASMSNSSDLIGQIVDKVVKQANKTADDITRQNFDDLRILRQRWRDLGYKDTSILFEVGRDGKLTGNIISKKNWGDWESDRYEFIENERKAFREANPDLNAKSEIEIGLLWDMWLRPKMKDWNAKHSIFDKDSERWLPNDNYINPDFEKIVPQNSEIRKWYNDYMHLKMDIDKMLPEGSTLTVRMPQFRGTFMNKVQNRHMFESKSQAFKHTLRSSLRDAFCETSEDSDFGNLQTYNSEEESLVYNPMEYEKEKMNRIPLYGINKLTSVQKYKTTEKDVNGNDVEVERTKRVVDMSDLSTDLFHTTLAYASMANSYAAVSSTVDVLEVGRSVLNERSVAGVKKEYEGDNRSRAYKRYVKYLEKQVYGVSMPRHKIGNLVIEKIAGMCTRLSAYMFLGGNVFGGAVNLGTGSIEILKEAFSGEDFNMKDWKDANKDYFSWMVRNFGSIIGDYGRLDADNFMDLLSMRWNIFGENKQEFKDWETRHSWVRNAIDKLWFLPYKAGEHYMQLIPFIAMAKNQKLWNSQGDQVTLMDLYKTKENEDKQLGKYGKTLDVKWENELYFKTSNGKAQYDFLQGIIDKMSSSTLTSAPSYTKEELDYLNSHNLKLQDTENTKRKLRTEQQSLVWTENDESLFMNAAREVANRLHGIYNNIDKVMLSQNVYGNMFLAMKGWALGMLERRIASDHASIALGGRREGSLVTMAKLWSFVLMDRKNFQRALLATVCPLSKKAYLKVAQMGFSANQFRNMRRNWADLMAVAILTLLQMLTAKPPKDDEDDETLKALYGSNWKEYKNQSNDDTASEIATGIGYYMFSRLRREQTALFTIRGAYYESGSLLNIKPAGVSATADLIELIYKGFGALIGDKENKDFFYQGSKKGIYEKGDPKVKNLARKYTPYIKSSYVLKHPYEAAKSFDFSKDAKN